MIRPRWSLAVAALLILNAVAAAADRPNIVILLADDLGNADLGHRGSDIKTPNIDALARGGVRLESYYGLPVCTPARAALLTGRYPMRQGLQTLVIFPSHKYGLPTDEKTLPQALKVEVFRGAIRKGNWKLVKTATLPGKTELFDLSSDPGETQDVSAKHAEVVADLEARLMAYAREQKPSLWMKSQVDYLGFQGATVLDPDYNIDGGLPTEKPALPKP